MARGGTTSVAAAAVHPGQLRAVAFRDRCQGEGVPVQRVLSPVGATRGTARQATGSGGMGCGLHLSLGCR